MNDQIVTLITSIVGFVIVSLLGGNIYFVKNLITTINNLKDSVIEHKLVIETEKIKTIDFRENCKSTHDVVNNRLNQHSKKLAEHEQQITILKERGNKSKS